MKMSQLTLLNSQSVMKFGCKSLQVRSEMRQLVLERVYKMAFGF